MKDQTSFRGVLATPMEPIAYPLLDAQGREAVFQRRAAVIAERMELLVAHFGIEPAHPLKWYLVASQLAQMFVPGLTVRDPNIRSGAGKVWNHARLAALIFEMDREIDAGLQIKQAAYKLSKRSPWAKIVKGNVDKGEALRAQYTRAHRKPEFKLLPMWIGMAANTYLARGDVAAWEKSLQILASDFRTPYV